MNNAPELIRGDTNFSKAPYDWYDPRAMMRSFTPKLREDPTLDKNIQGAVWPNQLEDIYVNPKVDLVHTSSFLPHESGHTAQSRYEARMRALPKTAPREAVMANLWQPNFSQDFKEDLKGQFMTKDSPYYSKTGIHLGGDETMSFLIGREAELPAGKTLMDDPYSNFLFRRNPGSYEVYTTARDKLKATYKEFKR
jgi:hypothetical protein